MKYKVLPPTFGLLSLPFSGRKPPSVDEGDLLFLLRFGYVLSLDNHPFVSRSE